jgi:hypothetical protein
MSWNLDARWPSVAHQTSVAAAALHGESPVLDVLVAGLDRVQQVDPLQWRQRVQRRMPR